MNRNKEAANAPRGTWRGTRRKSEFAARKPVGGFCFVPAMAILSLWWAYQQAIVGLLEVRIWLAAFEAVARRCGARDKRRRRFVEHELARLVGVSEDRVRRSLRRLQRAGFLWWSETAIRFGYGTDGLSDEEQTELREFVEGVKNHRRKVPLPRSVIKRVCRATRPVLIATVLGHALRCLYYRNGACCPDGTCKASWVSDVFNVDARNVKAARKELVALGMLIMDSTDQRSMNRWGPRVRFNLDWRPAGQARRSPPLGAKKRAESPPLKINRELVSRSENQEPAARGPTGACASKSGKYRPKPELVTPRDLADPERIAQFYTQAVRQSLIRHSESERLNVFAAAEHAKTYGTTNPCGLFVWLVKQRRWSYLTLQDEDDARHAIRSLDQRASASHFRTSASLPTQNGSASDAARSASPEAARRLLAGTSRTDYPMLTHPAASRKPRSVGVSVNGTRTIESCTICRTPSVAIGSSPREAGRPLGPDGDGRAYPCCRCRP